MKLRTETDNRNYNSVDLAKFICAVFIIMLHIAPFGQAAKDSVPYYLNFGIQKYAARLAVPFFFITSGYFLYRKTVYASFSFSYTKKYAVRILKLYLIWTLIYFPISLYGMITDNGGFLHSFAGYLRNVVFVGSYTQLWYLNGLIVAVCIVSFMLHRKIHPLKITCTAFLFYLAGLLGQSWFGLIAPIREAFPPAWNLLKLAEKLIVTTRNGLFFGFLFVSVGMVSAYYDIEISKRRAAILFFASMVFLLAEVFFLKRSGFIRGYDMYFFLVPSAFFMFCLIRQINLPDHPCYPVLRIMSSLMFYTHLWISWILNRLFKITGISTLHFPVKFIAVLFITLAVSYTIYVLSCKKRFSFLKKLYT